MYEHWLWICRTFRTPTVINMSLILLITFGEIFVVESARNNEIVISVRASDECDMRRDVLLIEDMSSETAYLQCKPAGRGVVGFWQWLPCPPGQKFYFTEQKCDVPFHQKHFSPTTTTSAPISETTSTASQSITVVVQAYLNDSCANGQHCAGGTVCDDMTKMCKCPLGSYSTPGTKYCQHPFSNNPKQPMTKVSSILDRLLAASPKQVSPGSSCRDTDIICSGGSFCNPDNKVCSCPDGSTDEGGKCVTFKIETATLGHRCNQYTKCDGWSVCIANTCQCESPLVQVGFQCLPEEQSIKKEAKPGQPCDKGQACLGGSICSTVTLKCTCPVGTRDGGDKCIDFIGQAETKLAGVGEQCDVNTDCVIGAYCSAGTNPPSCQCLSTHVELNEVCYRIIYPGQRGCEFDDQCSSAYQGSTCISNLCVCPSGMNAQGQTCRPGGGHLVSPPGGSCAALQQCSGGSLCRNGWCICPDNTMVVSNGMCTYVPTRTIVGFGERADKTSSNVFQNMVSTPEITSTTVITSQPTSSAVTSTPSAVPILTTQPSTTMTTITTTTTSPTITTTTMTTTIPSTTFTSPSTPSGPIVPAIPVQPSVPNAVTNPPLVIFTHPPTPPVIQPGQLPNFGSLSTVVAAGITISSETATTRTVPTTTLPLKMFAFPGDFCSESTTCTGGSKCLYGQCLCDEGYELINKHCIRKEEALPLASCVDGEICIGGSVCDGTICRCPHGTEIKGSVCHPSSTVVQTTRRPSVMWAPPLASCANGERCSGDSMCNRLTLMCECPGDMQPIQGHCVLFVGGNKLPGSTSEEAENEMSVNSFDPSGSGLIPKTIVAKGLEEPVVRSNVASTAGQNIFAYTAHPSVHFPNEPNTTGKPLSRLNELCLRNQDCAGGAFCAGNRCVCPPGTTANQWGNCIITDENFGGIALPLGSECNANTHCYGSSQCINGRCRCPSGFMQDGPVCISLQGRNVSIGNACGEKDICQGKSVCTFGVCMCPTGTKEINGVCQSLDVRTMPKPGHACLGSEPCSGNSFCVNGTCQCWIGFVVEDDTCVEPPIYPDMPSAPGDPCRNYDDCFGGSYCRLGYCVCPMGTESINMKCVPSETNSHFALPGKSCAHGEECTGGSFCLDGACVCPAGMHPHLDGLCRKLEIESLVPPVTSQPTPAKIASGPFPPAPSDVVSQSNFFNPNVNGPALPVQPRNPVQTVQNPSNAFPPPSENVAPFAVSPNNAPQFPPSAVQLDMSITPRTISKPFLGPLPGTPCKNGQLCQNGSICSRGFCRCPAGLKQLGDSCIPEVLSVPPGHTCTAGQNCTGGSECVSGVCFCKPGQKIVGTVCLNDTTTGKLPFWNASIPLDEEPVKPVDPTSPCFDNEMCVGGAICFFGSCICPYGTYPYMHECRVEEFNAASSSKYRNVSRPGELCTRGQRCMGASYCAGDGYCRCTPGTKNDKGLCRRFQAHQRNNSNIRQSRFAAPCPLPENETACQLPNCYCSKTGRTIPGGLAPERTPQFVVLSFDDPVNSKTFEIYQRLFDRKLFNKNGCPIKATFFVSHEWTNYDEVEWLYLQGHEIASNSITHTSLRLQPATRWAAEMDGQRKILTNFAGIPAEEVIGVRVPQLALGGDVTFEMMQNYAFTYDNSMTTNPGAEQTPFWPQTLDYKIPWECQNIQCPQSSFPGVWEIPINQFFGFFSNDISHYKRASMVSAAMASNETHESALNLLRRNFKRAHHSNKAPYVLTLTADFFTIVDEVNMEKVLEQFIQEVLQKSDVWIVTMKQLLDWMRQPTPVHQLSQFQPFQCTDSVSSLSSANTFTPPCQLANKCYYRVHALSGGEHLFTSCRPCPAQYPWLNNPDGN